MSMSIGSKEPAPAPVAVTPPSAHVNHLTTRSAWEAARTACQSDPGAYHGDIACCELHWFEPTVGDQGAWIRLDAASGQWHGFDARTLQAVQPALPEGYRPWHTALDSSEAPFYRWFGGALTNACFNEIDRHVLEGHGAEAALWFEGDRWDQSQDGGRGGPVVSYSVSRKQLLLEVARCALALRNLGLRAGDRIAINMPKR